MTTNLQEFLTHDDPIVRNIANQLNILHQGLYNEEISREQFEELSNDLFEIEQVKELAGDVKRKALIMDIIKNIRSIIGVLPI